MLMERKAKPPPPHFVENFVRGGWRKVERMYGSRTDVLRNWFHICGGHALTDMGREYRMGNLALLDRAREMDRERAMR